MLDMLFGRKQKRQRRVVAPKPKQTKEEWALGVANRILRAKSADKNGSPKFWIDLNSMYNHPHLFGANIDDDGRTTIAQAAKFAEDIQNALARQNYDGRVSILSNPWRVEVIKPVAKSLMFEDYWPKIKSSTVDELRFNGILFYHGNKEHLIGPSIAEPPYTHMVFTGATRSGKTVVSFACALSLAYRNSPEKLTIVLCDRKGLNLKLLANLPHVPAQRCAVSELDINQSVRIVYQEMRRRAETQNRAEASKHILLMLDEMDNTFADDQEVANLIMAIAKEGAEWGIHLWLIGQKLAGNIEPGLYQNLSTRLVGSTNGNRQEAMINSGDESQAHKLPTGLGIFEFRNGGTLLNKQTPVIVRALYIPDVDRNVPAYVTEIRKRWEGKRPFWNMNGWQPEGPRGRGQKEAAHASLMAVLSQKAVAEPVKPSTVIQVYRDLTGRTMAWADAHKLLREFQEEEPEFAF